MWSFYFLAKALLFFAGYFRFDAWLNLLFLAFTLLPLPLAWSRIRSVQILRQLVNGVAATLLLWHDAWLPPFSRVVRFLIDPSLAPMPSFLWELLLSLVASVDLGMLALAAVVLIACILAQRVHAAVRLVPALAIALASIASLQQDRAPVAQRVDAFIAEESARTVAFTSLAQGAPPFDIILLHVCSLSWDDLDAVGLSDHPLLRQFDVVFTQFNTVTSYSDPSAYRLLRSGCGQSLHGDLFGDTRPECYLLDQLRRQGFKTYAALDHDGQYAKFTDKVQRLGHIDTPEALTGIAVHQHSFDGSPIFDGYSVLERWWRARAENPAPHVALYYNSITLHTGGKWGDVPNWQGLGRAEKYRLSAQRLFSSLERFFALLSQSGRNAIVILVPEHGTALRGTPIQISTVREIPLPHITRVPLAAKFFGEGWSAADKVPLVVNGAVSYQAIAAFLAKNIQRPPFGPGHLGIDVSDLPQTRFLAENGGFRVAELDGSYYAFAKGRKWVRLPERALTPGIPGQSTATLASPGPPGVAPR